MKGMDLSSTRPPASKDTFGRIALAIAVLGFAWAARVYWTASEELGRAKRDRVKVEAQAADLAGKVRALEEGGGEDAVSVRQRLAASASVPRVLEALTELLPPDVRLEDLTFTYERTVGLDMRVAARHPQAYDLFLERLQKSPFFVAVLPANESHDKEVAASVHAEFHAEGVR